MMQMRHTKLRRSLYYSLYTTLSITPTMYHRMWRVMLLVARAEMGWWWPRTRVIPSNEERGHLAVPRQDTPIPSWPTWEAIERDNATLATSIGEDTSPALEGNTDKPTSRRVGRILSKSGDELRALVLMLTLAEVSASDRQSRPTWLSVQCHSYSSRWG
jgi:hypothetical protein